MTDFFSYLLFGAVAFGFSLALTPVVRSYAVRSGRVAAPRDDRWHSRETALLGGVGIFVATVSVWLVSIPVTGVDAARETFLPFVLCAGAVFVLGLVDDLVNMDPQHKLVGQLVITSVLVFFGFRLEWTGFQTVNLLLSIVWIVGITNAFNLLDNMDGLAAGIAVIGAGFLFAHLYMNPSAADSAPLVLLLTSVFMGAVLGFLVYNFNPASIFMGDAGSLFMGFVLACLTLQAAPEHLSGMGFGPLLSVIAIPVLILFIPIVDTGFVSFMRKLFRRPISQGGRDHSSHRMVAIGFSERRAVVVLYCFALASGLIALGISRFTPAVMVVTLALYLLFVIFFWIYLAKVKVYSGDSIVSDHASGGITPILVEITYRRRLFEVMLDFALVSIAYYSSYLLRFEGDLGKNFDFFLKSVPIVIAAQLLSFYFFGMYRGIWERTSLRDLIGYVKAITAGTVISILVLLFFYRFYSFSRAVFFIYWGIMLILVSLSRLSFRLLDEGIRAPSGKGTPALIYGAGTGGIITLKEIERDPDLDISIVGFIDDNPRIHKKSVRGYPVLGGLKDLEHIIGSYGVRKIIISFKDRNSDRRRRVEKVCRECGLGETAVNQMEIRIS